ncbi:MAG TPA: hypothetical protein VE959_09445 [Bryobacteraceae bacterium]|nr:hypothetical protein [Bryobacteraceae bacterium]
MHSSPLRVGKFVSIVRYGAPKRAGNAATAVLEKMGGGNSGA